jgi:hypothetical protein
MIFVDLVGPFTIKIPAKTYSLFTLTMIDPDTGWFEIVEATNKSATLTQDLFHYTYFARYPRSKFIFFDNGREGKFKLEFKKMLEITIMALKPNQPQITTNRPQVNAIIERVQKAVNDMLR